MRSIDTNPKRQRGFRGGPCPWAGAPSLMLWASMFGVAAVVYAAHGSTAVESAEPPLGGSWASSDNPKKSESRCRVAVRGVDQTKKQGIR